MPKYAFFLFFLTLLMITVYSKVFEGTVNIATFRKAGSWHYLGRMTLRPGKTTFNLITKISFQESRETPSFMLEIVAVPNHLWQG